MSTFSPNLRLELITSGTQAGAWGNTTNTNLGTLVEGAVSGYATVSIASAAQALTALYGAPDESRNAIIKLTTTTTAAFAVYIPPSPKEYTLYNSTAYVATIYCSTVLGGTTAAGAGVAIPALATMTVWSDGTVVRQQNTHLIAPTMSSPVMSSPTMSDPTMSGVPTAPTAVAGTNTTQVATTAFATALGASVLASPTFTGTPAAPTAAVTVNTAQLATTAFVHSVLPKGTILLWSGAKAAIPTGWALCDGTLTTPNLQDKFIVGAGSTYAVAATGGAASVTSGVPSSDTTSAVALTTAQMPLHGHPWLSGTTGVSSPSGTGGFTRDGNENTVYASYTGTPAATTGQQIGGTGGGGTHSHTLSTHTHSAATLPPYYALCYIMKTTG